MKRQNGYSGLARLCTVAGSAIVLFACSGSDSAEQSTAVTIIDSLGVSIVTNQVAASPNGSWRIGDLITSIGAVEGDSTDILGNPVAARRLPNGHIAISDQMANHIRVYDWDGRYVSTHGRPGEGPGEFQYIGFLFPYHGDSIVAEEMFGRRISVLGSDLTFGRVFLTQPTFAFRTEGAMPEQSCCRVTGTLDGYVVMEYPGMIPTTGLGARRSRVTIVRLSATGTVEDTIGTFDSREYYPAGSGSRSPVQDTQLSSAIVSVAADSTLYITDGKTLDVRVFGIDGKLRQINRIGRQAIPVDDDVKAQFLATLNANLDEQLERYPESASETESYRRRLQGARFHETVPAINTMMVDRIGNLWVTALNHYWNGAPSEVWEVFNPSGRWLASVEIPSDLRVLEFGDDYVVGLTHDELEVPFVRVYQLLKSEIGADK